ncbi:FtsK/SpoIIIE domain-containing protein [Allorhizocola rhizosphaerae]|uniref:FtsK/SpoIIIE domain-containing protein n=1 Tax=Allorhizocola rhizosphaerae TaxID=1872709 RepID=UPI000E3ECBC5|nr:FtsK/SpoIIIE domain-containing protein [Allorhizocola rhizosphaerae]
MFGKPVAGDRHPERVVMSRSVLRKPTMGIPWPLYLLGQLIKCLYWGGSWGLKCYLRFWWVTMPATVVGYGWWRYGWGLTVSILAAVAAGLAVWWWRHPATFSRWLGWFYIAQWRRWFVFRKPWYPTCANLGLAVAFDGDRYYPSIIKVRRDAEGDLVTVRMLHGQHPNDWAKHAARFAYAFNALSCRVRSVSGRRGRNRIVLHVQVRDSLVTTIAPLPVPAVPDLRRLPVAIQAGSKKVFISLVTHVLIAGASGAGKGSVLWAIVAGLAAGVRDGTIRLYGFDAKGGVELINGEPLFHRLYFGDPESMAGALEDLVKTMKRRQETLRQRRQRTHEATPGDPTIVIVIDEFGAMIAYLTDKKLKERINAALSLILSQGRAVGVHVVAALQDPRKEILPFRNLFTTRIALRLNEESEVGLILDDDAVDRGAACHEIPESLPGVAYMMLEGDQQPVRLRFPYHDDTQLAELGQQYRPAINPPTVLDGQVLDIKPVYEVNR